MGPALHRRQVLGLVHDDVTVALGVFDQPGEFVEQDQVGGRPAGRFVRPRRPGPQQRRLLAGVQQAVRGPGQRRAVGEESGEDFLGADLRPDRVEVGGERPGPFDAAHPGGGQYPRAPFGLLAQPPYHPGAYPLTADGVGRFLGADLGDEAGQFAGGHPPPVGAVRYGEVRDAVGGHARVQGPAQHLGHARVVFDGGRGNGIGAGDRVPGDLRQEGRLADARLAERGQDLGDVAQEGAVGAEDEQAGALEPLGVGVQEVGGAVQADGGLAGAGRPLDAHRVGEGGAYEVVLLGLDGGGDVPHGSDAGPLDLAGHDVAGP
ncbi:hypothetical protein GCM10017687_64870 [Streptomyces echinatus]